MNRIIEVSGDGYHIRQRSSLIELLQNDEVKDSVTLEDLSALIVDNRQTTITAAALSAMSEANTIVLFSNPTHLPCGVLIPLAGNTLHTERLRLQTEVTDRIKRSIWRDVIRAKIKAQAKAIERAHGSQSELSNFISKVQFGDDGNVEAQVARRYWSDLFARGPFRRVPADLNQNMLLNYGYSIIRSAMARSICAAGLHPALGIHHRNKYNPFCLTDDLMEPFRPVIDLEVFRIGEDLNHQYELSKAVKARLISVLFHEVIIDNETVTTERAMERSVSSFVHVLAGEEKHLLTIELK